MEVNIMYFAAMRETAGLSEEKLLTDATNVEELFLELMKKYEFKLTKEHLKVAVNEEYVPFSTKLNENDTVVFIPPVAGG
ncbi:MAG: molybdopterin converting factor subunit 1 [Bacteriovoracaceae bacterium]|nr:molybdopterin converting factor subunit 1 [Bacteriovoracaceae bacterium]